MQRRIILCRLGASRNNNKQLYIDARAYARSFRLSYVPAGTLVTARVERSSRKRSTMLIYFATFRAGFEWRGRQRRHSVTFNFVCIEARGRFLSRRRIADGRARLIKISKYDHGYHVRGERGPSTPPSHPLSPPICQLLLRR